MKRVKLKRDMNHKNRLTLANSGGRFCYEVTNYRVDKFSFSYKLLLTFFFFLRSGYKLGKGNRLIYPK